MNRRQGDLYIEAKSTYPLYITVNIRSYLYDYSVFNRVYNLKTLKFSSNAKPCEAFKILISFLFLKLVTHFISLKEDY